MSYHKNAKRKKYEAKLPTSMGIFFKMIGKAKSFGTFDTAKEAAVVYATVWLKHASSVARVAKKGRKGREKNKNI